MGTRRRAALSLALMLGALASAGAGWWGLAAQPDGTVGLVVGGTAAALVEPIGVGLLAALAATVAYAGGCFGLIAVRRARLLTGTALLVAGAAIAAPTVGPAGSARPGIEVGGTHQALENHRGW
ncbi:MAG: hypothetical protein ACT4OX_16515 [Actinomycetota bacterium]